MKEIILDAYAQALIAAKSKGMIGEQARLAARTAAARVVSKASGKAVTPDMVADIVARG